jgi:hypothetical protein
VLRASLEVALLLELVLLKLVLLLRGVLVLVLVASSWAVDAPLLLGLWLLPGRRLGGAPVLHHRSDLSRNLRIPIIVERDKATGRRGKASG